MSADVSTRWSARARRAMVRNLLVLVVVATAVGIAADRRFAANPNRPVAQALVDRMESVYRDVRAGTLTVPATAAPMVDGVDEVRTQRDRWALAGSAAGTCYAMWWGVDGRRHVRTVPEMLACRPGIGASDDPETVARSALRAGEEADEANWPAVLPPVRIVQPWWIPLLLVAGWVALSASTRIVVLLVSRGQNLARWTSAA